jgi:uncharacterized DUF497 family protein
VPRRDPLEDCTGFEWDDSNAKKNWDRHAVTPEEAEEIFLNEPLIVRRDLRYQRAEERYYALGQTMSGRLLFAAFTIRRSLIRVISVRSMNQNEAEVYRIHERNT